MAKPHALNKNASDRSDAAKSASTARAGQRPPPGEGRPQQPLKSSARRSTRDRTVQSSVSLRPGQWERVDDLADLTQWGRSGVIAQAVDLLTALPVPLAQRVSTLQRTTVAPVLQRRLLAAVAEAVQAAEDALGEDPWAEYDASLAALGRAATQSSAAGLSEEELIAAADQAKREVRAERRGGRAAGPG